MLKYDENRRIVEIELENEMIIESLREYDLDMSVSENGALAHVGDSVDSRENFSGFSKSQGDIEGGKEKVSDISRGGLSGFSSVLSPELETQFQEDLSATTSVEGNEMLSYSKGGSVFSSLRDICSRSSAPSAGYM